MQVARLYHAFLKNLNQMHELAHTGKDHTVRCQARVGIKKAMKKGFHPFSETGLLTERGLQPFSEFYAASVVISCMQDMTVMERVKLANVARAMTHITGKMHTTLAWKVFSSQVRDLQQRARRLLKTIRAEVAMAKMVAGM